MKKLSSFCIQMPSNFMSKNEVNFILNTFRIHLTSKFLPILSRYGALHVPYSGKKVVDISR